MKTILRFLLGSFILFILLASSPRGRAASLTWDGNGNGFWTNAANWTPGFRPTNGDSLFFPDGPAQVLTTNAGTSGVATNFRALTFSGSNYFLFSPPLSLTNGLTNAAGIEATNMIIARITARSNQTWRVAGQSILVLRSNVNFTNVTLTVAAEGVLQMNGTVSATTGGTLNKTNNGRLELNSIASVAQVNAQDGTLEVNGVLTGALTVNAGATLQGTGSVPAFVASGIVHPSGFGVRTLTVPSGAAVFNAGSSFRVNVDGTGTNYTQLRVATPPTITGATFLIFLGYNPLLGDSFVIITNTGAGAFTTTFNGRPEGATQTVNNVQFRISYVGGSGNDVTLTVVGFTANATTAIWDGAGANNLWLNSTNWSNNVAPGGGQNLLFPSGAAQLVNSNNFPSGSTFNGVTFLAAGYEITGNPLTLLGGIEASHSSGLVQFRPNTTFSGPQTITLNDPSASLNLGAFGSTLNLNGMLTLAGFGQMTLSGNVNGTGGLEVDIFATLSGSNSYSGVTHVTGALALENSRALGATTALDDTLVDGSLVIRLPMTNAEPLRLAGTLDSTVNYTWSAPLTILGSSAVIGLNGGITGIFSAPISGTNVLLSHLDTGTLILSASNSVSGTLIQGGGNLFVNGAALGLNVDQNSGVLGGTGEVANITSSLNGIVRAGQNRNGVLTCSNFTVAASSPVFYVEVSAGVHNQLRARGNVQLNGDLFVSTVFNPPVEVPFIIINNESPNPVLGTFLGLPEGSSLTFGSLTYRVSYVGGDGNDVTLELIGVVASGVTRLWDAGGANNFWSNRTNWSGDTLPEAGDAILFPANLGAADFLTTNDLPPGIVFDQLIVRDGTGGSGTVLRGNAIGLLNGVLATNTSSAFQVNLPLQLSGAQTFALSVPPFTFSGPIALDGSLTFGGDSNVTVNVTGEISGPGGLVKTCPGGLTLSGDNGFAGAVQILNGSLTLGQPKALGLIGGGTFMSAGTTLVLNFTGDLEEAFLSLASQLSITTTNVIRGQVELPNSGTSFSAGAGRQLTLAGILTGAGSPLFQGGGTFIITGTNDCAGETLVQNSALFVNGRSTTGDLSVNSAGVLGGTGVIGRVSIGNTGTLNPGASPGVLSSGNLSLFSSSIFLAEINGLNPGTQYDQMNVTGTVSLSGGMLALALGFTPIIGTTFTLIENDGADAVLSPFAGLPEGATFLTNGLTFRISYLGGSGNDVTITRVLGNTGVTRVWDGGGANAAWNNSVNWVGDVAPVEGDNLFFPVIAARKSNTNNFPAFFGFNSIIIGDGNYLLGGAGVLLNAGLIATNGGSPALNVPVQLNASQTFLIAAGSSLTSTGGFILGPHTLTISVDGSLLVSGPISGAGGMIKSGVGHLVLSGSNSYAGVTALQSGGITVNTSNALGSAAGGTVVSAGAAISFSSGFALAEPFVLNGFFANSASLQFNGGTSVLSGSITLGADTISSQLNVQTGEVRVNGVISGGSLTKGGLGRLVLNANNTHTNLTEIGNGTLIVNGSQPASTVQLNTTTVFLGGTGTVGSVTAFGGTVSPGASPGVLTLAGALTNGLNYTNHFELNGPLPGSGHDQLVVLGNVFLNGSALRLTLGFTPAFGDTFIVIDNQGLNPITGSFAGLPEGSFITNGPTVLRLTYQGGSGNDVMLTRIAVPTGVTRVWDGGGVGNLWSTAANWAGDVVPQPGDNIIFPDGVAKNPMFDAGTNVVFNTLLLGRNYIINVSVGHSLRLIAGMSATNLSGVVSLFMPVTLENSQTWTVTRPGGTLQARALNLSFATLAHAGAGNLELLGDISGSGGLVGNSSAGLFVDGANTFDGTVVVNSGTLTVLSPGALGSTLSGTFIGTAGRVSLDLPPGGFINEPLTLAGRMDLVTGLTNSWHGSILLAGAQAAFDTATSGQIELNGVMGGGGFQTLNLGTLVLNGADAFTGPVRVGGTSRLLVNSGHAAVTFVLTNSGRLGGTGVVGVISVPVCTGCEVQPGPANGPGVLHSGNVNLGPSSRLRAEINGVLAGSDYDQLDVTGVITITNASLVVTAGFNPGAGVSFTLINNDGAEPIAGIFTGLPQNALLTSGAVTFQISYTGGDGNDVVLTRVTAAPPSTIQPLVLSNGVPVLTGMGNPNVPYVLEATTNLNVPIPWQPILTNTSDGAGVYEFLDFGSTNFPMRFYRVLSP